MKAFTRILLCTACATCIAVPQAAFAQAYPVKPVRIVVPFPPGGTLDVVARLNSAKLRDNWRQPIIIETVAFKEVMMN